MYTNFINEESKNKTSICTWITYRNRVYNCVVLIESLKYIDVGKWRAIH